MTGNNVAVTVGYSVFALTMQWGACVVFGLSGLRSDDQSITCVRSSCPSSLFECIESSSDFYNLIQDISSPRRQVKKSINLLKNLAGIFKSYRFLDFSRIFYARLICLLCRFSMQELALEQILRTRKRQGLCS